MKKVVLPRVATSQSFTDEEIKAMSLLFDGLLFGRNVSDLARHRALHSVMRKGHTMRASVERARARRDALEETLAEHGPVPPKDES